MAQSIGMRAPRGGCLRRKPQTSECKECDVCVFKNPSDYFTTTSDVRALCLMPGESRVFAVPGTSKETCRKHDWAGLLHETICSVLFEAADAKDSVTVWVLFRLL